MMGVVFPELKDNEKKIQDMIRDEEQSFENTLAKVILVSTFQKNSLNHSNFSVKFAAFLHWMNLCLLQINVYIILRVVLIRWISVLKASPRRRLGDA